MAVQLRDSDDSLHCDNLKNTAGTGAVTATYGIAMPAGQGIDFSASAGGGATSSLLDDYEEGTWTPEVYYANATDQAAAVDVTQYGFYTKIGNVVTVSFDLTFDASALTPANDNVGIKNLPYSSLNSTGYRSSAPVYTAGTSLTSGDGVILLIGQNDTVAPLVYSVGGGNLGDDIGTASSITFRGTMVYKAN